MSDDTGAFGTVTAKSIQMLGLPGPDDIPAGPAHQGSWYHEAMQLPVTRVSGYFGTTMGSPEADEDVQIFFYEKDHLQPTLRFVADVGVLHAIWIGIGRLLQDRYGLVRLTMPDKSNGAS